MGSNSFAFIRVHSRLILLFVCAAIVAVLWALQVTPYLNPANDAGRYMVLGESLAQTGELRLINDIQRPPDTLYPPAFPALIACWLKATGRDPGGVVLPVKLTQAALLVAMFPLLYGLLEKAGLRFRYRAATLLAAAISPALIGYANEVMSEIPFLLLCLASVVLVERDTQRAGEDDAPLPAWKRSVSLACAALAFLVRTAALPLFLVQCVWFWRRFGWKWGVAALAVMLLCVGGWQIRNRRIIRNAPPGVHYQTYQDQFYLRDPMTPNAGRIRLRSLDLVERAVSGAATYTGMISRAYLNSMSVGTPWLVVFYVVAIPFTLLVFIGFALGWQRGLRLSGAFTALFWCFTILWPWRSARFLVPLLPFLLLYGFLGVEWVGKRLEKAGGARLTKALGSAGAFLLFTYCAHVQFTAIRTEHKVTAQGYTLGRNKEEGGFYAACDWLKQNGEPGAVVMGRPAYLLHLYTLHPTTQLEPTEKPRGLEAYLVPRRVQYIVEDVWSWAHSVRYLAPYFGVYGDKWKVVWTDPLGSDAKVWQRVETPAAPSATPAQAP